MDEDGARLIANAAAVALRELHERIRAQLRGLDDGMLNWRPLPKANSIATMVIHTLGSEREMVRSLRLVPVERDRESEFHGEARAEELLAMLDAADRDVDEYVVKLTAADLGEPRPRGDRPWRPGVEWLITNYGHAREHLGQIELTRQLYDSRS